MNLEDRCIPQDSRIDIKGVKISGVTKEGWTTLQAFFLPHFALKTNKQLYINFLSTTLPRITFQT